MLQERFKSGTQKIYIESLNDALTIITGKLETLESIPELKRQVAIKNLIEQEINTLYGKLVEPIQEDMQGFAEIEHEGVFSALNDTTGVGYAFASLPKETMKKIISMNEVRLVGDKAYTLKELFDNAKTSQINNYKQIIAGGLASNSGYRAITKNLKLANAKATTNLDAIVHTAISSARDEADKHAYKQFDDVITGWKSVSVLDSRTSLHCASLDGRKYYKKKGYPVYDKIPNRPPRHFRCRSKLVAMTDFTTDATRQQNGDEKGQISNKTNFNDWFSNQSEGFQKNYLGPARYDLYKTGKLQIKDFVDIKSGERFTLAEIREKFVGATPKPPKPKPIPKVDKPKKTDKKSSFVPVKTTAEGEARLRALGIPNVKLQGLKGSLLNTVIKGFEEEHRLSPLKLNSVRTYQQKRGALATYSNGRKEVSINKQFLKESEFSVYEIKPYAEEIKEVQSRVDKWTNEYLDNPRYNQKSVRRTLRAFKNRISDLERKVRLGEEPQQWTVGSVLGTKEEQLGATVIHELGHHRHYELYGGRENFDFNRSMSISTYGKTNHKEYFAEWYTQYRLYGPEGVPEDILELFRGVDK